ncbi:cingulin isoform X2 [Genypterus blacodes]|uniref:cingulin isoform X2 n=1 Tax=Genypterus blacodes TaxID=154954 RepID=UPI003F76BEF4
MSALSSDRKQLVDYGVQIRFIKDLHDTGGGFVEKSRAANSATPPSNKYGVAVRVQGISGQPYVVLKDGEKGDSYGVQLNTPQSSSGPPLPYDGLTPRKQPAEYTNPYKSVANTASSPVSTTEEEDRDIFGSPSKRPPGDGQAGTQGEEEGRVSRQGQVQRSKMEPQAKAVANGLEKSLKESPSNEEYNEAGLKPVRFNGSGPRGFKKMGPGFTQSMGRRSGNKMKAASSVLESFPEPSALEEPAAEIDRKSVAPITKLISKFNSDTPSPSPSPSPAPQTRGRSGARQRLRFDQSRRSRSLDAHQDERPETALRPPASPTPNPYAVPTSPPSVSSTPLTSSAPTSASLRRNPAPVAKATALTTPKPSSQSPGKFVAKDTPPAIAKKPEAPIPMKRQGHSVEVVGGEEANVKQAIYDILKEGCSETESSLKRRVNLVYDKARGVQIGRSDGNQKNAKLQEIQEQLNRCKADLRVAHDEVTEERMAREGAESRLRQQEDVLAMLQEELRTVSENPHPDSLQMDVVNLQADLADAARLQRRQDEILHQRERELTALKGALKEEVECHDKEMEALREQYSQDMQDLRMTMEQVTQSQEQIEEERQRVNDSILCLEEELDICRTEGEQWKTELEASNQELQKCRSEKQGLEGELVVMKKQKPAFEGIHSLAEELQRCHADLKQGRAALDKQKGELDGKIEALQSLKRASGEREGELQSEIDRLKEQAGRDKAELEKALEKAKEASAAGSSGRTVVDHGGNLDLQEENTRLRERLSRVTRRASVHLNSEAEETMEALQDENRSLKSQLDEARRGTTRLSKERDELTRRLEEREMERDALRRGKSDLEEQKRLLDRALEKINKEMEMLMGDSRQSVATLQTQLDDYRDRSRKDLLEAQRNGKERLAELQRAQSNLKTQQEEVSRLRKELLLCGEERDSAQLERDLFSNRLKHMESEVESEKSTHTDRHREIRALEDKIKSLEIELDEEKSSVELLNDRVLRSRDQVDQLRSELMQERSARHDLEMDKSSIERQVKELKTRVADLEGQTRNQPSSGFNLLESKLQELEERLHSEEREKASIQACQRRTERKLKELNATLDLERNQHAEQRDQLSLRVKGLKRQVDESECEVERLEGVRRKVLRDLEEQQESQQALHAKVTALESELKRKQQTSRPSLASNLSSEDEDGFYDTNITSMLKENHLQTSNS